ncbi:MAG: hypothetical protein WD358_06320 [Nitriliruptoraceae bacterium]
MLWSVVGITALATLLVLAVTFLFVARRMRGVVEQVTAIERQIMPEIERLQSDLEVRAREWERIGGSGDAQNTGNDGPLSSGNGSDGDGDVGR